jgi:hypothetical protein
VQRNLGLVRHRTKALAGNGSGFGPTAAAAATQPENLSTALQAMLWQRTIGARTQIVRRVTVPTPFQPPRITDCRRCTDSCFCLCESPSMVFGPIAMGPGCIGFSRKRSPTSRCARSFHRSASPNHFQLRAWSNTARWRLNRSIWRQPAKSFMATPCLGFFSPRGDHHVDSM